MPRRKAEQEISDPRPIIKALPTQFLTCRTMGHAWDLIWWGPASQLEREGVDIPPIVRAFRWEMVRVAKCLRCDTVRDEFYPAKTIDPYEVWRVQQRRYRYEKGYSIKGYGQTDRRWFSEAAYRRWMEKG